MYTQCANCETVFKLSAEVLRVAGGQVRCGRCGDVFNALARLAEDASAFETAADHAPHESAHDLEVRADHILGSDAGRQASQAAPDRGHDTHTPGIEIARLQVLEFSTAELSVDESAAEDRTADDPAADASMEFTLPPGELDRIFVDSKRPRIVPADKPPAEGFEQPMEYEETGAEEFAPPDRPAALQPAEPYLEAAAPARHPALWLSAAGALSLLLAGQVVHQNREWLAAHGPLREVLRSLYSTLGAPVPTPANLSAYQLRQWGVTGDPTADATLRVRASILNTASQLEPYPLLRVTLANRYGAHIGTRDFEPAEYMGKPVARLIAPGERVDATLQILDPGKDAEGFEIDVCLRGADKKISCAGDAAAPRAK